MPLAGLRHVDLCVSDLGRSLDFYRVLLGMLGWKVDDPSVILGEQGEEVTYLGSPTGHGDGALELRAARERGPVDRYEVGLHHIALNAACRDDVDAVWGWIENEGIENEGPPRPCYSGAYYAVFFRDPDGIKVEVVHRPRAVAQLSTALGPGRGRPTAACTGGVRRLFIQGAHALVRWWWRRLAPAPRRPGRAGLDQVEPGPGREDGVDLSEVPSPADGATVSSGPFVVARRLSTAPMMVAVASVVQA